ncbi:hypothetical protein Dda_0304 [Drechslerella dactyloides]|uniref:Uncharacterized protein n=1 Tax=Drechslerella dactyloides TaxID=74499 RepID=A0AAD6J7P5_DREDA|nr:hypothetical protein Dda_0304 [Drechslerella dactyloides]
MGHTLRIAMSRLPTPNGILGPSYSLLPLESQLLLVTSVLGTSTSWVVYSLLNDAFTSGGGGGVVLVSFLNEVSYFCDGGKRHGLDIQSHLNKGDLIFVDGLSRLFLEASNSSRATPPRMPPSAGITPRGAIPTRTPISPRQQVPSTSSSNLPDPIRYVSIGAAGAKSLNVIKAAVQSLPTGGTRPRVIIEGLDVVMAAAGIDVAAIEDFLYELREVRIHTIPPTPLYYTVHHERPMLIKANEQITSTMAVISPSDSTLTHTSPSSTPLELSHANLLLSLSHTADAILSLRLLDTGVAKDISGVLRVTRGAGNLWRDGNAGVVEEKELLYHEADAGVRIFARGSGGH